MASKFSNSFLVWLKQPDYPWWPGIVVDPTKYDLTMPEGQDTCVLCLPSSAPTVAFANSSNPSEIVSFRGPEEDADLVMEGRKRSECAPAVEEALAMFTASLEGGTESSVAKETDGLDPVHKSNNSDTDKQDDGGAHEPFSNAKDISRHRQHSRREKRHKSDRKHKRRERKRHRSSDEEETDHDDDTESEGDEYRGRSHDASRRTKERRHARQTSLGEYALSENRFSQLLHEDASEYYHRRCKEAHRTVADATLLDLREKLGPLIVECLHMSDHQGYEMNEDAIMELLRPLSTYDVTFAQLRDTHIGSIVGQLLNEFFPERIQQLAKAILHYWFQHLPSDMQSCFSMDTEIDRCSIDTTVGDRSEGAIQEALSSVGIHILDSFTDEETFDTPPSVDPVRLAKAIEDVMHEHVADKDTLVTFLTFWGDEKNTALRRAVLEGKLSPEDLASHAAHPHLLLHSNGDPRLSIDPASPTSPFSESNPGQSFSPTSPSGGVGNVTTQYVCPNCGAQEAYRTGYSVQAHDNYPSLLRCVRCDTTWNLE